MNRGLRAWWPVAAWMGVILIATSITLSPPEVVPPDTPLDKVGHFVLYAVLGWLAGRALRMSGRTDLRTVLVAAIAGVLFAALDEWHQQGLLDRYASVADWLADSAGLLLGLAVSLWLRRRPGPAEGRTPGSIA